MTGTIESVWRYPVKSMRGETVDKIWVGYSGLIGDRIYAIHSDAKADRFPWHTARVNAPLILHKARFRSHDATLSPQNPQAGHPNLPDDSAFEVDVETPEGIRVPLDDPEFIAGLPTADGEALTLLHSPRNFVDVTPVSLVSLQTIAQLETELDRPLDPQRFRMNFHIDWSDHPGFHEHSLVGKHLKIGEVEIAVTDRDARCKMITLDPSTGAASPEVLKHVLDAHDGCVGIYGSVLREGFVRAGDPVEIL